MKLLLWNEKNLKDCDDKQIFLKLVEDTDGTGDINLAAVNPKGETLDRGNILLISQNMRGVIINGGINTDIPIKTDFYGHACFELGRSLAVQQKIMEMQTYRIVVGNDGAIHEGETEH